MPADDALNQEADRDRRARQPEAGLQRALLHVGNAIDDNDAARRSEGEQLDIDLLRVDPQSEREQLDRLAAFKADRDGELVERRLEELRAVARGSENLLPAIHDALRDRCSLGKVCGAMRDVFGRYRPQL